jgi:3-phenylpropionate/trans-cinnamate dioxygenase ferredoxin subunit
MRQVNSHITTAELAVGTVRIAPVGERRVLLCRTSTAIYALEDRCPHAGLSLEGSKIRGDHLFCPHHGARFRLHDGCSASAVTPDPLRMFPVKIVGDEIQFDLP